MRSWKTLIISLGGVLIFGATLYGQFNLGTITGRITDPSGAVVPGCQIKVENAATKVVRTAETDATGLYTVTALDPGRYSIVVSKTGFKEVSTTVDLGVTQSVSVDLQLTVGAVSQTISVEASTAQVALQKEDHAITQIVPERQIESLPMNGRNLLTLATLGPGAQAGSDIINGSNDGGSAQYFQVTPNLIILGGQSVGHTTFLQDGVSNTALFTQSINILPDPDSVQEFSVDTNGMDAKFDQPSVINVVTKSGSNRFHGSAYDYFRNRVLDAQSFFGNVSGLPKGVYQYNQFGGTLGGPIRKDKEFFFFNYEGLRNPSSSVFAGRIPTTLERQGNFSEDLAGVPVGGGKIQSTVIYDPDTYNPATDTVQAFPGNIIPTGRLSSFATTFNQFWPAPGPILADGTNYRTSLTSTNTTDLYLGRVDYNLSMKDTLYGLVQDYNSPSISDSFVPNLFGNTYNRHGDNAALEETHIFTPTLLNVGRVGYNRSVFFNSELGVGAKDWVSLFGLQNLNPAIEQNDPPYVSITGCCGLGNPFAPQGAVQNRYQFADELDYTRGKHKLSAGVDIYRVQFDGNWELVNSGFFTFNGQFTGNYQPGASFVPGLGLADFMLGLPNFAWGSNGNTLSGFRATNFATYFQDNWRVTPKFTLNLGVRYEYDSPPGDKYGHAATYSLSQNAPILGSWNPNTHDFSPRIGLAYSLTSKTVVRAGFGMYYTSTPYNVFQFQMAYPPNFHSEQLSFALTQPTPMSTLFPSFSGVGSVFGVFAMAQHNPDAYMEQWNLNVQRTLGWDTVLSVAYVGDEGHHLSIRLNPNQASPAPNPLSPTPIQSRRPYPAIGDILAQYPLGNSNYNSLQVRLEKHVSHDLSFLASYTYSKSLDLLSTDGGDLVNGLDPERNYGPSDFDRTNNFALSYVYQLPFGTGKHFLNRNDWVGKGLGGWQVNGITSFDSGLPFGALATDYSDTGGDHEFYADRVCNGAIPVGQRTRLNWFNTSCFTQPAAGTVGDAGRNILRMGGIKNWNFSIFKIFALGESRSLEFRSEFFNFFNQHSFSLGNGTVNTPSFGEATGTTTGPREIQFALKLLF
jgi:hypothetical protein